MQLGELTAGQVFFDRVRLDWDAWVAFWEADQAGGEPPQPPVDPALVLPTS